MTLPVSGAISFNNINVELGVSGTTQASLGQTSYRNLAGVASGAISMSNFYGKANQFAFTISANQVNANLRTLAINAGWNGTSKVVATINSGVWIYSNSTGTPALTVSGSFPNGAQIINNGNIVGMGGAGGNGANTISAGGAGGTALSVVSVATSVQNNATIAGGGGGGGGSAGYNDCTSDPKTGAVYCSFSGGGGGGGGRTGLTNSAGGARGNGSYNGNAGAAGTSSGPGLGGYGWNTSYRGGTGGAWGAAGATGTSGAGGGAGGAAVTGNSNITWLATGTRLGGIS